jgi:hypothetical protein
VVKTSALGLPAILCALLLLAWTVRPAQRSVFARSLAGAIAGVAITLAPYCVRNIVEQGLPWSPYPLRVLGVTLGRMPPELVWASTPPASFRASLAEELDALAMVFGLRVAEPVPSLGPLAMLFVVAAPFTLLLTVVRRGLPGLAAVGVAMLPIVFYASPAFTYFRIQWANANGRFLQLTFVACVLALLPLIASRTLQRVVAIALWVTALVSTATVWLAFTTSIEVPVLVGTGVAALMTGAALVRVTEWPARRLAWTGILVCVALVSALVPLDAYRLRIREAAVAHSFFGHRGGGSWRLTGAPLDSGAGRHVAVTLGPHKWGDRGFLYFLLGARLQNRLTYVPPTRDGSVPVFAGQPIDPATLDADRWLARLAAARITHVVALTPGWIEQSWMDARPAQFRPVVRGVERDRGALLPFGLYEYRSSAAHE